MAIYEGKWRCPKCQFSNLSRDIDCKTCGSARGEEVEFFLDERPLEVINADLIALAKSGAGWICGHCRNSNRNLHHECASCGNKRTTEDHQLQEEIIPEDRGSLAIPIAPDPPRAPIAPTPVNNAFPAIPIPLPAAGQNAPREFRANPWQAPRYRRCQRHQNLKLYFGNSSSSFFRCCRSFRYQFFAVSVSVSPKISLLLARMLARLQCPARKKPLSLS